MKLTDNDTLEVEWFSLVMTEGLGGLKRAAEESLPKFISASMCRVEVACE